MAGARFEILPAIDLRGGRVVRLRQGDFGRQIAYSDDPVAVARAFVAAGARWLHVVDLEGARAGEPIEGAAIRAILDEVGDAARVEQAGGLRTDEAIARALANGAARVVVGTRALDDPAFAERVLERFGPERLAVALDVRGDRALGGAWRRDGTSVPVGRAIDRLITAGIRWFEVTAIDRDGLLGGPDLDLLGRLQAHGIGEIVAAGGIASLADVQAVRELGCAGAIIGRALYEGRLDLAEVLAAVAF